MTVVPGAAGASGSAVLDASVLIPAPLCDALLRVGHRGLYRPCWTEEILEEVRRNLISKLGLSDDRVRRRIVERRRAFPEASVEGYQGLVELMTNDPKDRHVLAAAVSGGVPTIVTSNVRHFPKRSLDPFGIRAQPPADFLLNQLDADPRAVIDVVRDQAEKLQNPPMTVAQVLDKLAKHAPQVVVAVGVARALDVL